MVPVNFGERNINDLGQTWQSTPTRPHLDKPTPSPWLPRAAITFSTSMWPRQRASSRWDFSGVFRLCTQQSLSPKNCTRRCCMLFSVLPCLCSTLWRQVSFAVFRVEISRGKTYFHRCSFWLNTLRFILFLQAESWIGSPKIWPQ